MKEPQGRPRHQFQPNIEFTQDAYQILEAAARTVLTRMGLLDTEFITKDDLISHCWIRTFFYVKTPEEMANYMFLHAQTEMANYIKEHGAREYQSLHGDDANDVPIFDTISPRELDDPFASAALVDEWRHLSPEQRQVLFETIQQGERPSRAYEKLRRRQEALQLLQSRRFTRRERYIAYQCLVLGRPKRLVARELGLTRERIRQIVRDLLAGRAGRPRH